MKTLQVKVYEFAGLSNDTQEKVIEKLSDINTDYNWFDFIFDDAKEVGKLLGIEIDNILFSGFYSQGDGAMFEGSYAYVKNSVKTIKEYAPNDETLHEIAMELQAIQSRNFYGLSAKVKHYGRYYHENSNTIDIELIVNDGEREVSRETEKDLSDVLRRFMKWIYKQLENEYEYKTSKDAIIETIELNNYVFLESGEMANHLIKPT